MGGVFRADVAGWEDVEDAVWGTSQGGRSSRRGEFGGEEQYCVCVEAEYEA